MSGLAKNVVIVGAGVAGRLLKRDIERVGQHRVVGFVDDEERRGVSVVGKIDELDQVLTTFQVDEIIIAIPSADGEVVRRVLLATLESTVPVRIVPREAEVLQHDAVSYGDVKDLEIDDWLGRSLNKQQIRKLERFYHDQVVVVTGGAGSIGSEIVRQLLELGAKKVISYDSSEYLSYRLEQELMEAGVGRRRWQVLLGDVTDGERLTGVLKAHRPDHVFHAAAYKHVHLMEENVREAVRVNALGTRTVMEAATETGVERLTFVSTDKAVNPTSIMGATKRMGELYVLAHSSSSLRCNVVRFGNVVNSRGSVLPKWEGQIRDHRLVSITDLKMERFFMSIREAAHLVLASATRATGGGIYVLDMGDLIPVVEVAKCLIRSKNLRPETDVRLRVEGRRRGEKMTEELFTAAERRRMSRTRLSNIWQLRGKEPGEQVGVEFMTEVTELVASGKTDRVMRRTLEGYFPTLKER